MDNMKLIEAKTLSTAVSQIDFNTIPQTYTDLKLVMSARGSASNTRTNFLINFNGSSSGFTWLGLYGYGSTTGANGGTGSGYRIYGNASANSNTANLFSNSETYISNYSSTSKLKQAYTYSVIENNGSDNFIEIDATVWNSTSAITSLSIFNSDSSTFMVGSTFYLYGVSNTTAGTNGAKAYGGYVTEDSNYFYHTFLSSGTFTPTQSLTCDYLVIAGGGGGGTQAAANTGGGAGGGAGGLRSTVGTTGGGGSLESPISVTAQAYAITVGAGGVGATSAGVGATGSDSVFSTITSSGGGGGGGNYEQSGVNGGSGGGAGQATQTPGAGTANQGYAGGNNGGNNTNNDCASGGGGAGGVGGSASKVTSALNDPANSSQGKGGDGGAGVAISAIAVPTLTGVGNYYAGGGGGGNYSAGGVVAVGGSGVGGTGGGTTAGLTAGSGIANTGSGGGGGGGKSGQNYNGGSGGSGLVVIRYAK